MPSEKSKVTATTDNGQNEISLNLWQQDDIDLLFATLDATCEFCEANVRNRTYSKGRRTSLHRIMMQCDDIRDRVVSLNSDTRR